MWLHWILAVALSILVVRIYRARVRVLLGWDPSGTLIFRGRVGTFPDGFAVTFWGSPTGKRIAREGTEVILFRNATLRYSRRQTSLASLSVERNGENDEVTVIGADDRGSHFTFAWNPDKKTGRVRVLQAQRGGPARTLLDTRDVRVHGVDADPRRFF